MSLDPVRAGIAAVCGLAFLVACSASSDSKGRDSEDAGGTGGGRPVADGGRAGATGGTRGTDIDSGSRGDASARDAGAHPDHDADTGGGRVMVRIASDLRPDFLTLDACFGKPSGDETLWVGPLFRDDFAHGATFNRVTAYRELAPGATLVRFVAHGGADCNAVITGLSDQQLEMPLILEAGATTWFTVIALGGIAGQGTTPFSAVTLVDRETVSDTPFGLRVVALDPKLGPVEVGSIPNPDYTGYDKHIGNVAYGIPSPYTSWTPSNGTPLYFGFKVFLEGHSADTPLIVGDRAQSDPTGRGSWSLFVVPSRDGSDKHEWSFCADGAEGPRLCYPCGRPGCEGQ